MLGRHDRIHEARDRNSEASTKLVHGLFVAICRLRIVDTADDRTRHETSLVAYSGSGSLETRLTAIRRASHLEHLRTSIRLTGSVSTSKSSVAATSWKIGRCERRNWAATGSP
jgi:hypothetical protein